MPHLQEGHSPSLALFQTSPTETGIESIEWVGYRPVSQLGGDGAIEFNIPGTSTSYVDLKRTRLYVKVQILKDGKPVGITDEVGLINLPLQTMWSQVDLALQHQVISPTIGNNYAYRSMISVLLENEEDPKLTQLLTQLFYQDTRGYMDASSPTKGSNNGLMKRWEYTCKGGSVDMEGPLYVDICSQDRFILNGVPINIKLWPNKDNFRLMTPTPENGYKLEITDALLKVCMVRVSPGVIIGHGEALKKAPASYPFTRSDIRTFAIPAGQLSTSVDDIFQGLIPSSIILALTASEGYSGNFTRNPFNFAHFNCSYVGFYVNGQPVPSHPIQPNYTTGNYVDAYLSLFTVTGKYGQNSGNFIGRDEYDEGYSLYALDVDGQEGQTTHSYLRRGHSRLELRFSKPLPEGVTLIVYGRFPCLLQIDETRAIRLSTL